MLITACSNLLDTTAIVNICNKRKNKTTKLTQSTPKYPRRRVAQQISSLSYKISRESFKVLNAWRNILKTCPIVLQNTPSGGINTMNLF